MSCANVDKICYDWRKNLDQIEKQTMYEYYKNIELKKNIHLEIEQDISRADLSTSDFAVEVESGNNALYNVLRAYANYDPEIGYA